MKPPNDVQVHIKVIKGIKAQGMGVNGDFKHGKVKSKQRPIFCQDARVVVTGKHTQHSFILDREGLDLILSI